METVGPVGIPGISGGIFARPGEFCNFSFRDRLSAKRRWAAALRSLDRRMSKGCRTTKWRLVLRCSRKKAAGGI
jgi:hypothetical protein